MGVLLLTVTTVWFNLLVKAGCLYEEFHSRDGDLSTNSKYLFLHLSGSPQNTPSFKQTWKIENNVENNIMHATLKIKKRSKNTEFEKS